MKKVSGGVTTYYVRDAQGRVAAEYDGAGTLSAAYVYAGERRIAKVEGGAATYYLADHLGSTRALMDDSGAIPNAYDYWPYGEVLLLSGTDAARYQFTGHERDGESGFDNLEAREYLAPLGRFNRPDPLAEQYPGISPYVYAAGNPLKFVDPDGRRFVLPLPPGVSPREVSDPFLDLAPVPSGQVMTAAREGGGLAVRAVRFLLRTRAGQAVQRLVKTAGKVLSGKTEAAEAVGKTARDGAGGGGRGANRLKPAPNAEGPHTTFRRNAETGRIEHYQTFDPEGKAGGNKRFRGTGKPHGGVEPPLVLEPKPGHPGGKPNRARPAPSEKLPRGFENE